MLIAAINRGEIALEDDALYRALQVHLDKTPMGFPPAESGADIRLLKHLFTPEEARIATYLTYSTYAVDDLDTIYRRMEPTDTSIEALEEVLDGMASKGLLYFKSEGGKKFYNNANWVVGIYEYQVDRLSKEFLQAVGEYNTEAFGKSFFSAKPTQLRVIPIQKSITPESPVAQYDDIRTLVESAEGPFVAINCICRQSHALRGDPCKVTEREETCLGIGPFAKMYLSLGWGREISKEELIEIINQNEQEGLVLQPSNSEKIEFICSCCGCCCGLLRGKGATPKPIEFFTTNFYSQVDHDLCSQCGTCVDLCQMKALSFQDDLLMVNLDRCIGCGVCVANCPEEAITLLKRKEESIPPETMDETYASIESNRIRT
jgi:Pyruvate/2-oxoacid:ferredoxin oxidoreductase delta subunit